MNLSGCDELKSSAARAYSKRLLLGAILLQAAIIITGCGPESAEGLLEPGKVSHFPTAKPANGPMAASLRAAYIASVQENASTEYNLEKARPPVLLGRIWPRA